jgi:DNA-binding transcriptional MerR regulator
MTSQHEPDPNQEYTTAESAVFLNVDARTVRRYVRAGFLKARWRGPYRQSGYRVYGWSIIAFLDSMQVNNNGQK